MEGKDCTGDLAIRDDHIVVEERWEAEMLAVDYKSTAAPKDHTEELVGIVEDTELAHLAEDMAEIADLARGTADTELVRGSSRCQSN